MKLKDIIGGIGEIAGYIHPAIGGAIKAVNSFLPDDDKLSETATPEEIHAKIQGLPADVQAVIMEGEVEVEIAGITSEVDRYKAMVEADTHSTRPFIAKLMAYAVCWIVVLYTGIIIYAIHTKTDVAEWWPLFGVVIAVPAEVLRNYFGNLRKEQSNRLAIPEKNLLDILRGK